MARKTVWVPWYRPRRLLAWNSDGNTFRFVGWVWRQRANLIYNLNYGWVAFVDEQDESLGRS